MAKCIVVLEDNRERRVAMGRWLADRLPMYDLKITDEPSEFVACIRNRAGDILAASLDHDLHEREDQSTEITGMLVIDRMVEMSPTFPVLLHTSNRPDGERMRSRLTEAGWTVEWITPFDDTAWIGEDWYPALKRIIRKLAPRRPALENDRD